VWASGNTHEHTMLGRGNAREQGSRKARESGPGKTFTCARDSSFGEPRALAIDAERENRDSACAILENRVAILLETCIQCKSPNLANICHLPSLLEMTLVSFQLYRSTK
jgi:hypothetical protein